MNNTFKLKAGKYWVGDPCYVVPEDKWRDVCNLFCYEDLTKEAGDFKSTRKISDKDGFLVEYKNIPFFVCSTAYGDGGYPLIMASFANDKYVGECGVDSGTLSIIPVELINEWNNMKEAERLGVFVDMKNDFRINAEDGNFSFGLYNMITSEQEEEVA